MRLNHCGLKIRNALCATVAIAATLTGQSVFAQTADIIVLSDNVFEIGVEDIANTTVLLTMMDGGITYAEPSAAAAAALDDPKIKSPWQE